MKTVFFNFRQGFVNNSNEKYSNTLCRPNINFVKKTIAKRYFLPRDAILARYMLWPCVCLCLSQVEWLNVASRKQYHTIGPSTGTVVSDAKDLREILPGSPQWGAKRRWGGLKSANFDK